MDRADNHGFLENLTVWMEERNVQNNLPQLPDGYTAESVEVSNAMLFDIDENGMGLYQVQIQLTYRKRSDY